MNAPFTDSLATLVSLFALWGFARWPLRRLRRDLSRGVRAAGGRRGRG